LEVEVVSQTGKSFAEGIDGRGFVYMSPFLEVKQWIKNNTWRFYGV
jgi:hypothetical protein